MTLQDKEIKGSCNFIEGNSFYIPTLPKLIAINIVLIGIIVLVGHMILQDHMIIWSCDFVGRSYSG